MVRIEPRDNKMTQEKQESDLSSTKQENSSEMSSASAKPKQATHKRQDVWLWASGMIFILVLMGLIAAIGKARGWDADTSLEHNETETSQDRCVCR